MPLLWQKKHDEDGEQKVEVTLPEDQKKALEESIKVGQENKKTLEDVLKGLNSINARFTQEEEDRKKAAAKKTADEAAARNTETEEELEALALTDPLAATKKLLARELSGRDSVILTTRADNLRREVFEDQSRFPYYTGEIKAEIDKLLEGQTLNARNDRGVVENAYFSILGRHADEVKEGKLKSRFASPEGSRGTSSGNTAKGDEGSGPRKMTDDEKRAARILGFKEEEYGKMLDEAGIGMV